MSKCDERIEIQLSGIINQERLQELTQYFKDLAEKHQDIDLDMRMVQYLDSVGLGLLVSLHKRLQKKNGKLRLIGPSPKVVSLFKLTGLHFVLDVVNPN